MNEIVRKFKNLHGVIIVPKTFEEDKNCQNIEGFIKFYCNIFNKVPSLKNNFTIIFTKGLTAEYFK